MNPEDTIRGALKEMLDACREEKRRSIEYAERAAEELHTWNRRTMVLDEKITHLEDFLSGTYLKEVVES